MSDHHHDANGVITDLEDVFCLRQQRTGKSAVVAAAGTRHDLGDSVSVGEHDDPAIDDPAVVDDVALDDGAHVGTRRRRPAARAGLPLGPLWALGVGAPDYVEPTRRRDGEHHHRPVAGGSNGPRAPAGGRRRQRRGRCRPCRGRPVARARSARREPEPEHCGRRPGRRDEGTAGHWGRGSFVAGSTGYRWGSGRSHRRRCLGESCLNAGCRDRRPARRPRTIRRPSPGGRQDRRRLPSGRREPLWQGSEVRRPHRAVRRHREAPVPRRPVRRACALTCRTPSRVRSPTSTTP